MNNYRVVFRTAEGALKELEKVWRDHPEIAEVMGFIKAAHGNYKTIDGVYKQWVDKDGISWETKIH